MRTLDAAIAREGRGLCTWSWMRSTYGARRMNEAPRWARTGDSVTSVEANGAACLKILAARRM
jgi:hypothetical protein